MSRLAFHRVDCLDDLQSALHEFRTKITSHARRDIPGDTVLLSGSGQVELTLEYDEDMAASKDWPYSIRVKVT